MDHGGEAARTTTVGSTDLGMAGAVQGSEAHMTSGTFHGQLGAAAARRAGFQPTAVAYHNSAEYTRHVRAAAGRGEVPAAVFHREPAPGVAYANISASWRQLGPVDVVLVGPQLPDAVVPVDHNYGYSALQPRLGDGRGVVLVDPQQPGGVVPVHHNYSYSALQPRLGAGRGVVLVDLLHGGAVSVYNGDYMLLPSRGAGDGEVLVDLLPDGAGHGEVFVDLLPGGSDAVQDDYGVHMVYGDPGMPAKHLRRLLAFIGIGASSVAVNALAAGPGSPAVAFHLFVLLLAGLFLVILHVLRV